MQIPAITANALVLRLICVFALCVSVVWAPVTAVAEARTAITATGRIGPLQIDHSDRSAVVAFAGQPEAEETATYAGGPPFDALGYGCRDATPLTGREIGGRQCHTAFYISSQTNAVVTFFTTARGYSVHGVHIGTRTETAERLLGKPLIGGCETNFYIATRRAALTIADLGGHEHSPGLRVTGGHIYALVLHSLKHDLGLFDCL